MTVTVTPLNPANQTALFLRYPHQASVQPCYLYIDPGARTVAAETDGHTDGAVTMAVHCGMEYRVRIPAVTADTANAFMADTATQNLLDRICDGWSAHWNGSNHVGKLSDDAEGAILQLLSDALGLRDESVSVWAAADWIEYVPDSDLMISAETTDAEIEVLATATVAEARGDGILIYDSMISAMTWRRDRAIERSAE